VAERRAPSATRLRRALATGDTPLSSFAVRAASLATVAILVPSLGRAVAARFGELLRSGVLRPESVAPAAAAKDVAVLAAPVIVVAAAAALFAGMAQTGLAVAPRPPRLGRFFDALRAYDVVRAFVVALAVVAIGWRATVSELPALAFAMGRASTLLAVGEDLADAVLWPSVAVVVVLAIGDIVVRRTVWLRRLSPTPEEAKRERRESEVPPELRAARRREHERLTHYGASP
jgi:flagellar biosynthesis protein FlhB